MEAQDLVFVSGRKEVRAIDPRDGSVAWEQRLPGLIPGYITMVLHEGVLLVAHKTRLHAFDALRGDALWEREGVTHKHGVTMLLSGRGGGDQSGLATLAQYRAQQAAAAAAAAAG